MSPHSNTVMDIPAVQQCLTVVYVEHIFSQICHDFILFLHWRRFPCSTEGYVSNQTSYTTQDEDVLDLSMSLACCHSVELPEEWCIF